MLSVAASEMKLWLLTKPECFERGRVILRSDVVDAYNKWAKRNKCLPACSRTVGHAMSVLFPGIRSVQKREGSSRKRYYVLPLNETEDLL